MVLNYFLLLFFGTILLLGRLLWPFLSILILSFLLAGIFQPVYQYLRRYLSDSMAALCTCLLIILLVFIPLIFFIGALSSETFAVYQLSKGTNLNEKLRELVFESRLMIRVQDILAAYGIVLEPEKIGRTLSDLSGKTGLFMFDLAKSWAADVMLLIFNFFMMIIAIFFLLSDSDRLINYILTLSPLPDEQERQLIQKFKQIAGAVLVGNGICGLIQGVLGGLYFALFQLSSPIIWGCIMGILAFLPIFGIGLVLIPAAVILLFKGQFGLAVLTLFFYVVTSFGVEYLLKPKMVGHQVKMHTLLVFLAIIGGLKLFGFLGIIYGPLIIATFLTMAEIYRFNYKCMVTEHRIDQED
jgi:predicted PurR-regulated permease PerM